MTKGVAITLFQCVYRAREPAITSASRMVGALLWPLRCDAAATDGQSLAAGLSQRMT